MAAVLPTLSAYSLLLLSHLSIADHISPVLSPSSAPFFGGPAPKTIQFIEVSSPPSPPSLPPSSSPSPSLSPSPDLSPSHSPSPPSPSPSHAPESAPSPVPAPVDSEVRDVDDSDLKSEVAAKESGDGDIGRGMSGGMKAALAIGVVAGAGIVCLGAFVYIKRKENTRRARYGYAAREDLL